MVSMEDVQRMRQGGQTNEQIRMILKQNGVSDGEINNLLSQSDIKAAVGGSSGSQVSGMSSEVVGGGAIATQPGQNTTTTEYSAQPQGRYEGMQPSMTSPMAEEYSQQAGVGVEQGFDQEQFPPQDYGQAYDAYPTMDGYSAYAQYQPYQESLSSDVITEISEQVVSEKLSQLRDRFEKAVDFRTVAEARISNIDERLKRIEKILDELQLSILQKVGEYVGDVRNLKKDLEETQKSFKALSNRT